MDEVRFGPELISRMLHHLCGALPGCLGAGINSWDAEGRGRSIMATGLAERLDAEQHERQAGPLIDAARAEREVTAADLGGDGVGFVGVPGSWNDDGPVVLSVYLDHKPTNEDLRLIEEVEPLLATATAVVEFCAGEVLRADQMLSMVQHRREIEQAKGLVMAARGCQPGEAFKMLVGLSQHFNVKLRDVSAALVELVGGSLETPDELTPESGTSHRADTVARLAWDALRGKDPLPGHTPGA